MTGAVDNASTFIVAAFDSWETSMTAPSLFSRVIACLPSADNPPCSSLASCFPAAALKTGRDESAKSL